MGGLPALDSLQRMVLPDTPPELVSPSATSFSSRSSPSTDQAAWGLRAPHTVLSMSSYDKTPNTEMSTETNVEVAKGQPESTGHAAPRQQLPSLSSLFGPPAVRPLSSPHLERAGPYLSHSPLDRPRVSSAGSSSGSYFPRAGSPPSSQPRSTYDIKFDSERQPSHILAPPFTGSHSPGRRDIGHNRSDSRFDSDTSSRWSMQDVSRQEYSLGSRESPYRSPRERFRPQFPGTKDSPHDYSDQRPSLIATTNPPPTPASTVVSDVVLSKDGLGPKIWTGTHFLPRFVRAAEVPGEGMCYFYDDGSHCKTVIDGEAVNAHWGVTKAGKPRKRLAIACVTCREKKIKCDPDYPRCVQCEKFGRICKFKNAPRGGHNTSPSTPPAELDDNRQLGAPPRTSDMQRSGSAHGSMGSPETKRPQPSPDMSYSNTNKRLKVGPEAYVTNGEPSTPFTDPMEHSKAQPIERPAIPEMPRIPDDVLNRAWRTDPYVSDPQSINAALTKFFMHIDSTMILRFLPEDIFKAWVGNSVHRKSPEDLMLLYSTLAIGVALSDSSKHIAFEYAQVANYAQKMTHANCIQLVQCRILLAVYYISTARLREANELISSAAATAACLQLNLELDNSREASISTYPLGLNRSGYSETRRRTFWSLFLLERLGGFFPARPAMMSAEDIYTRLPADIQSFEKQIEHEMPKFNPYESSFSKLTDTSRETSGYLVEMVHIWSDCQAAIYRMSRRPTSMQRESFLLNALFNRLEDWHSALPSRLMFGGSSLEAAAFAGTAGSFLSMHLLYHHALIKLNRHRHEPGQLTRETQRVHTQKCWEHAVSIMDMVNSLERILRVRPTLLNTPPLVIAIAVTEAMDVLTAGGPMSNLEDVMESVRVAKSTIDKMAYIWESSSSARLVIDQRLQQLTRIRDRGSRPPSPVEGYRVLLSSDETKDKAYTRWQISEPIESSLPADMDILYYALA